MYLVCFCSLALNWADKKVQYQIKTDLYVAKALYLSNVVFENRYVQGNFSARYKRSACKVATDHSLYT